MKTGKRGAVLVSLILIWMAGSLASSAQESVAPSGKIELLSSGIYHTCAKIAGTLSCWWSDGFDDEVTRRAIQPYREFLEVPSDIVDPSAIAAGFIHNCVIDRNQVKCWGSTDESWSSASKVPPGIQNPKEIAVGDEHSCAIDDRGVVCWGSDRHDQTKVPLGLKNPRNLVAHWDATCVLTDDGMRCWGLTPWEDPKLKNPKAISLGMNRGCAIDDEGLKCFGMDHAQLPDHLRNPKAVAVGHYHACVLDDQGVQCFSTGNGNGLEKMGQMDVPKSLIHPRSLTVGSFRSCAVDDEGLKCWGLNEAYHRQKIEGKSVPGELLIKVRSEGAVPAQVFSDQVIQPLSQLLHEFGGSSVVDAHALKTDPTIFKVRLAKSEQRNLAIRFLSRLPSVQYAEPNWIYELLDSSIPNDPDFEKLWNLRNTGQLIHNSIGIPGKDMNLLPLWQMGITGSRNVLVGVIDSGIDWLHPDLAANVYTHLGESGDKAFNGLDDDGNGFVDDLHGWNFVDQSNNTIDHVGHGTHIAGIIGGVGDNKKGVAGINWNVSLLPIKMSGEGERSGSLEVAIDGINYAKRMKVQVINASWGGSGKSKALEDAIDGLKESGILFVAAAGNESSNLEVTAEYPAGFPSENLISVAAFNNRGSLADFSNFGRSKVHVAAPGHDILSTFQDNGYQWLSGTSMAAPHVTGLAALMLSAHPEWSAGVLKDRIIRSCSPEDALRYQIISGGRVDAFRAILGDLPHPSGPSESDWVSIQEDIETPHPFENRNEVNYVVHEPGAKYIRVHFQAIDLEENADYVLIRDRHGNVESITGRKSDIYSRFVQGDTLMIRLVSDQSNPAWGFKVDRIQIISDSREALYGPRFQSRPKNAE